MAKLLGLDRSVCCIWGYGFFFFSCYGGWGDVNGGKIISSAEIAVYVRGLGRHHVMSFLHVKLLVMVNGKACVESNAVFTSVTQFIRMTY